MPRIPRMIMTDPAQKTVYHVISRTALDGLPFKHSEKDELVRVIKRFSMVYAVEVLGFSIMGNHRLCGASHNQCYVNCPIM